MSNEEGSAEKKMRDEKEVAENQMVVSVTGMSCITCARAIEKQVKKLKGVSDVKAAIMLDKVFITYDPDSIDSATIKKAIDKTGYKSYMTIEEKYRKRAL